MWTFNFGPDEVTLTVEDFLKSSTFNSQDFLLTDWSFRLFEKSQVPGKHLSRLVVTEKWHGNFGKDEELSTIMERSRCIQVRLKNQL